jgi:hypothetical protein
VTEILGIDVGGVIIDRKRNDDTDTSLFGTNYLNAHAVEEAFETIHALHDRFDIFIVSKCGQNIERKTREWMIHNQFPEKTGVAMDRVNFCRQRADKAPICEKLGVTHFIDDKLEVLSYLKSVPNKYLFDPSPNEVKAYSKHLDQVMIVGTWKELKGTLLK